MIMGKVIAVLEDEPDIVNLLTVHLQKAGFTVKTFLHPEDFFKYLSQQVPDVLILDLMLPGMDGLEVCRLIKNKSQWASIPILMLSAKNEETDRILGLEMGAEDYMGKPFSPRELVARVKIILRRQQVEETATSSKIDIGGLLILDPNRFSATLNGKKLELTATEFRIIQALASKRGWVFTRERILEYLWNDEKAVTLRTVDVHIKNLREKIGAAGKYIQNVRGVGYKLDDSERKHRG